IAHRESHCRLEDALHQNIDQFDPQRADFAATAAVLMAESKPMLLDLQELLVKRQRFDRPHCPRRGELALCVRENLSEMTRRGHRGIFDFRISIFEWNVAGTPPVIRKAKFDNRN